MTKNLEPLAKSIRNALQEEKNNIRMIFKIINTLKSTMGDVLKNFKIWVNFKRKPTSCRYKKLDYDSVQA